MLDIDRKIRKPDLVFLLGEYGQAKTIRILGISKTRLDDLREVYDITSRSKTR